jgi:hypothetical protein
MSLTRSPVESGSEESVARSDIGSCFLETQSIKDVKSTKDNRTPQVRPDLPVIEWSGTRGGRIVSIPASVLCFQEERSLARIETGGENVKPMIRKFPRSSWYTMSEGIVK